MQCLSSIAVFAFAFGFGRDLVDGNALWRFLQITFAEHFALFVRDRIGQRQHRRQ